MTTNESKAPDKRGKPIGAKYIVPHKRREIKEMQSDTPEEVNTNIKQLHIFREVTSEVIPVPTNYDISLKYGNKKRKK